MNETQCNGYLDLAAKIVLAVNETGKARAYAYLMLNDDCRDPDHYADNIHYGNTTSGKIALAEGGVQGAASCLLLARPTPGSPELGTRSPDTELAKGLLERAYRDPVLQYIDLCAEFCERGQHRLRAWAAVVRVGTIPSFQTY